MFLYRWTCSWVLATFVVCSLSLAPSLLSDAGRALYDLVGVWVNSSVVDRDSPTAAFQPPHTVTRAAQLEAQASLVRLSSWTADETLTTFYGATDTTTSAARDSGGANRLFDANLVPELSASARSHTVCSLIRAAMIKRASARRSKENAALGGPSPPSPSVASAALLSRDVMLLGGAFSKLSAATYSALRAHARVTRELLWYIGSSSRISSDGDSREGISVAGFGRERGEDIDSAKRTSSVRIAIDTYVISVATAIDAGAAFFEAHSSTFDRVNASIHSPDFVAAWIEERIPHSPIPADKRHTSYSVTDCSLDLDAPSCDNDIEIEAAGRIPRRPRNEPSDILNTLNRLKRAASTMLSAATGASTDCSNTHQHPQSNLGAACSFLSFTHLRLPRAEAAKTSASSQLCEELAQGIVRGGMPDNKDWRVPRTWLSTLRALADAADANDARAPRPR